MIATDGIARGPGSRPALVWFRPSIRKVVWRLWRWAFLWVFLGGACLGAVHVAGLDSEGAPTYANEPRWLAYALYAIGTALVTAGPLHLLVGVQRVARVERVLSVHEDGLRWQDGEVVAYLPWARIEAIGLEDGEIVIAVEPQRFVLPATMEGIEGPALAAMLNDMRRKALLGVPVRLAIPTDRT